VAALSTARVGFIHERRLGRPSVERRIQSIDRLRRVDIPTLEKAT
jgi:hypothetical protein